MINVRIPIIQLVDGFATEEHAGGAAQFGIQLARHLDRERYAPHVVGLWKYGTPSEQRWIDQLRDEGIGTTILIEQPSRLAQDLVRAVGLMSALIERHNVRLVNSHFERGDLLGIASKLRRFGNLAIVRTMHTEQQWQSRPWLGELLNLLAFPWLFNAEVAISQTTREGMDQRFAARLRGRRAALLYNGISSQLLAQPAPTTHDANRPPRIAIVGRLALQKGHRYLFEALPQILARFPQLECWVIGHGELEQELNELAAELRIDHAVHFLGRRSDVQSLLSQVDLMVSSSIWEGFPTVILEAMAARTPVVASDVSGSRELVRDGQTGRLVPMQQPTALAQAVNWMLEHPTERRHMAERAWQEIHQYTLEHTAEGYDQLYRELLRLNYP